MAIYSTNEFKNGLKVMVDNAPCSIVDCEFVKPGKGQAFTRVKIRNLKTGRVVERTYKTGETLPSADVADVEMQYLYTDGELWHFMVPDNFEQYAVTSEALADAVQWLKEQDLCVVTLWNNEPIQVTPLTLLFLQSQKPILVLKAILRAAAANRQHWKQVPWYVFLYSYKRVS